MVVFPPFIILLSLNILFGLKIISLDMINFYVHETLPDLALPLQSDGVSRIGTKNYT